MDKLGGTSRLIESRPAAMVAFCVTSIVAARILWEVVHPVEHKSYWLLDMRWILADFAAVAVNMVFYAYLIWIGLLLCRGTQGNERVLAVGWFGSLFLGWIQILVSTAAAVDIEWLKAGCTLMAFAAAVDILLGTFARGDLRSDSQSIRKG
jgi:hypothetical protein